MPPTDAPSMPDARDRKAEHLTLSMDTRMQADRSPFAAYRFEHVALPEIAMDEVDTSVTFLGKTLRTPLLISSMTGGTEAADRINRHLAEGAERAGIALGVGSQRKAIEDPSQAATFEVRQLAPTIPLLGNLGAVQLNYGFGLTECERAVAMVDADALIFHLNPLQEAIQPEGQTDFRNLLPQMAAIARHLSVPVIVKEIGCGLSGAVARRLVEAGMPLLDVAGMGGTSWARIEAHRADDLPLGELFAHWGVPTPEAIEAAAAVPGATVIGSGGLRTGLDVAKSLALGAHLCGMAYPFLKAATESADAVVATAERITRELRVAMFCLGVRTIDELRQVSLQRVAQ